MRHAEHFLLRLDRLPGSEVEVALELYRDPDLLRSVLGAAALPEAASRVAVSLADPVEGPFLVVTRDGHFVTCLARGMKPGDLPIVTRGQLDALSRKFATLRERLELATRLTGNQERACDLLLRRVLRAADSVSREDFLAVSAWEPLLAPAFLEMYLAMAAELLEEAPILRSQRKFKGKAEEALHEYWNLTHAASHLALLGTMGGDREHLHALTGGQLSLESAFSFALTSTGAIAFIVKGAWAAGRLGKQLLPAYKRALTEDVAFYDLLDTMFGLVAMGRRTSGLRAEIAKALRAARSVANSPGAVRLREVMGSTVGTVCEAAAHFLEVDPEESERLLLRTGEHLLGAAEDPLPEGIPGDVLRAAALTHYSDGLSDGSRVLLSLSLISASARGAPEQFYFPRELAPLWRLAWDPALAERLLDAIRKVERAQRVPAVRPVTPGPNQPCSCGSGRKYKKCCGAPGKTERSQ